MLENAANSPTKADEDFLTFDVPDDALERTAAPAGGQAITVGFCTQWYTCGWPL